jgi:micrococcal nuclease
MADMPPAIVYDGDTFRLGAERVRILNIDTPELGRAAKCSAEANLALLAKARLAGLLGGSEGRLEITRKGKDRYGRTLALVTVAGRDAGGLMIDGHLAVTWGGRRHDWCALQQPKR